jgi:uncharacterized protein
MRIDIHTHCFPDELAGKAIELLQRECGYPVYHDGTAAALARSTRAAGLDYAVVQPIATRPSQTASINRWAAQLRETGCLLSFGTIHPEYTDFREEIRLLASSGIRGVKFHPEYQHFFVDEEQYYPLYDAIFAAGLAILFHAGGDIGLKPPYHCLPEHLSRLLDVFPGAPIIAAHMGGYSYWDEVETLLIGRPLYLDTSFSLPFLGAERSLRMIRQHGVNRILFGSDSPWRDQAAGLAELDPLDLLPAEREAILGGNAARLLGLPDGG